MKLPWQKNENKDRADSKSGGDGPSLDQAPLEDLEGLLVVEVVNSAESYVEQLLEVRRQHPVDVADLLSDTSIANPKQIIGNLIKQGVNVTDEIRSKTESLMKADNLKDKASALFRTNTNVVEEIKKHNVALHTQMRTMIEDVARRIESGEYSGVEDRIHSSSLAAKEREAAVRLVDAHKQSSISVKALRLTVSIFKQFNRHIVNRLSAGQEDRAREKELVLANAVLVYEISNFVIRYMEGFKVWGIEEIKNLRTDVNRKFEEQQKVEAKLKEDAQNQADETTRKRTLEQIATREKHALRVKQDWDAFINEMDGLQKISERLEQRLATLKVIRDNARNQITFVDLLTMTATVKDAINCLDAAVVDVEGLELVPITEERVERLLSLAS